jgi:DNA polymerase-4
MDRATASTHTILDAARSLVTASMPMIREQGLTCIGVAVTNLDNDDSIQLVLPFDSHADGALDAALDGVREKFGSSAIGRALLLGRDQGLTMPMLPD